MKKISFLTLIIFFLFPYSCFAFKIETLQIGIKGDFILSPGKTEIWLNPGEKVVKEISVTNRSGKEMKFKIEIEDFSGSFELEKPIILFGEKRGPYSLKDYLKPEIFEFSLSHGQRITIPIEISIPKDAEPGGKYGAVIVSTVPQENEKKEGIGVTIISRLANLFFVRVKGDVKEEGYLKEFKTNKKFYSRSPIKFQLIFENRGNVHLVPYGIIEIFNLLGKKVTEIEVKPWYSMPNSLRIREIELQKEIFLFGIYQAKALINRGYQNIVDQKSVTFWVLPIEKVLGLLFVIILVFGLFKFISSKYEIKRKS